VRFSAGLSRYRLFLRDVPCFSQLATVHLKMEAHILLEKIMPENENWNA